MKVAKIVTWFGLVLMTVGLINGFVRGNFFSDGKKLLENPQGLMSLIDLYVGFGLFSMWIIYREDSYTKSIIWTILMMVLGFFTGCLYVLKALYESKEEWNYFFQGSKGKN